MIIAVYTINIAIQSKIYFAEGGDAYDCCLKSK
jgi:hypothetical protein